MVTNNSANTYIVPTTANEVTMPLQPCFAAYNSATDSNVTGDSTNYTVICDTVTIDQNSDYNNGTGTLTSPVTGRYYLGAAIYITGATNITAARFYINTSNRNWAQDPFFSAAFSNFEVSIMADMDAADTATISVQTTDGAGKVDDVLGAGSPFTWFVGNLEV